MTGYESKKKAASAKTIDEVNWADHEPDGRRAAQEPAQEKYTYGTPLLDAMTKNYVSAQEPVAWLTRDSVDGCWYATANKVGNDDKPLYTTPPQRTWIGLTAEEIMDMYNEPHSDAEMIEFGREVEAKLKEKNNG